MKRSLRYFIVLLLAIALTTNRTFSQVNNKQSDADLRPRAYKLLESLAEETASLQSGENRVRMYSNIAGSLWPHNESKARALFATVAKEIKAALGDDENDPNRIIAKPNFIKLREDTALRIGMFDPEGALQFLAETEPSHVYISDEDQNNLKLRLAILFTKNSPDLALKLGRESIKQGVLDGQFALTYELSKKSREQASALLGELVKIAPYQNIRSSMQKEQFYFMLARTVEPTLGREPSFRDLMNYFTDVALAAGCGKKKLTDNDTYHFCYRMGPVIGLMEKVDAKRVAPLKYLARGSVWPYEWSPELAQYVDVYDNGSLDDLFAMIPKYPEFSEAGQSFVIRKIMETGDFERARKLADEFVWKEPSTKQSVLKDITEAQRIVSQDTSAELIKEAEAIASENEVFLNLFRMANKIGTKNPQTTLKLLDRASDLLEKVPPQRWKLQYQIGIAMRYCQVKSNRCFTMMEPIVSKMNELVAAATRLNLIDNHYLRNGEWNMTAEGGVGSLLTMLAQNAAFFALCDFDRALALSNQFERREIRMMAQLKLAQGVLSGPPKRSIDSREEH